MSGPIGALGNLSAFSKDGTVHVVIESPRGSTLKLKYEPTFRVMMLSRPLPSGVVYPHDWGFIPSTCASDGDPLDAVVMWDGTSYPGVVLPCRLIGLLRVLQTNITTHNRERNDRVVGLPVKAARWDSIQSVFDLGERSRVELEHFFMAAVAFEGKELEIAGWAGPDEAISTVRAAAQTRVE